MKVLTRETPSGRFRYRIVIRWRIAMPGQQVRSRVTKLDSADTFESRVEARRVGRHIAYCLN
jgi:hypothetical protein